MVPSGRVGTGPPGTRRGTRPSRRSDRRRGVQQVSWAASAGAASAARPARTPSCRCTLRRPLGDVDPEPPRHPPKRGLAELRRADRRRVTALVTRRWRAPRGRRRAAGHTACRPTGRLRRRRVARASSAIGAACRRDTPEARNRLAVSSPGPSSGHAGHRRAQLGRTRRNAGLPLVEPGASRAPARPRSARRPPHLPDGWQQRRHLGRQGRRAPRCGPRSSAGPRSRGAARARPGP